MEEEMLFLKDSDDNIANDERLLRLSEQLRRSARHAVLHQLWKSSSYGVLCFLVFTFVGCGMLYGGYLINEDATVKEGDIFIVVLSMALIVSSISTTTAHYKEYRKGMQAALSVKNLEQLEQGLLLTQNGSRRSSVDDITITSEQVPMKPPLLPEATTSIDRFANGTRRVLRNYHNHKLFLLLAFILAAVNGLEQPAHNLIMGEVFTAMLRRSPSIRLLIQYAIQFFAVGFGVFVSRTAT
ncbi:unnamed protein product, partial [Gongylonema pulchrum]|uniref:ABC transmembrane type-1 domain-containing protein n=1 Tax=Gongylonema pulchrum TaxID=637853 RepID=A0A183D149_9BILA